MTESESGGRRGKSQAKVHTVFSDRLRDLQKQAKQSHAAFRGISQRGWQVPTQASGSLLDIANLHNPAFEREAINTNYVEATRDLDTAGTNGDVIALKQQMDYNACEERAYRARHTSLVRAMCLAHGRRAGQGYGDVWAAGSGIEAAVAANIAAGALGATTPAGGTA